MSSVLARSDVARESGLSWKADSGRRRRLVRLVSGAGMFGHIGRVGPRDRADRCIAGGASKRWFDRRPIFTRPF